MTNRSQLAALSVLFAATSLHCSDVGPSSATKSQAISGGEATPDDSPVFFLEVTTSEGTAVCSATLVTRDLLLTAAHCLSGQFGPVDCDTTTITNALPLKQFRLSHEADLTGAPDATWTFPEIERLSILHPGAPLCGNDLALIQLKEVYTNRLAKPATVPREPDLDAAYRAVGYGAGHPSGTGERVRRMSAPLHVQCATPKQCATTDLSGAAGASPLAAPTTLRGEFVGEAAGCPGDSGGPALVDDGETGAVIGVLSRGTSNCATNVYSMPQSVAFRAAVRDLISDPDTGKGYTIPAWAQEPDAPPRPDDPSPPDNTPDANDGGAAGAPSLANTDTNQLDSGVTPVGRSGCTCSAVGASHSKGPWGSAFTLLLSLLMVGARRQFARARATAS